MENAVTRESPIPRVAVSLHGRGGTTLWSHEDDGFSVIVFQTHDDPEDLPTSAFSSRAVPAFSDDWDMVELRVISALSDLKHFWDRGSNRVTHKKWSWVLVNMDPAKDQKAALKEISGYRDEFWDFNRYEEMVDKAIDQAKKAVAALRKLKKKVVGNFEPWAESLKKRQDPNDPDKDRFWCLVCFPDDFQWVVKLNYGLIRNFGLVFPRYWEVGYRFDDYRRATAFAKDKIKQQMSAGYEVWNDAETRRVLKWCLKEAMEDDD